MVRHDTRHLYKNVGIVLRYLCEFSLYKFSCNRKFWVQNFICSQRANTVRPYILPQDLVFFSNTYRHKIQAVRRIIITLKTYFLSSWQIFTCHILFSSKYLTACSLFFAISSRRLSKLSNIFSGRRNSCSSSFSFLP